jgi:hypothetical protein
MDLHATVGVAAPVAGGAVGLLAVLLVLFVIAAFAAVAVALRHAPAAPAHRQARARPARRRPSGVGTDGVHGRPPTPSRSADPVRRPVRPTVVRHDRPS